MPVTEPYRIQTISQLHSVLGLPRPGHPLISLINLETVNRSPEVPGGRRLSDFNVISLKRNCAGKFKHGQQHYGFKEGVMYFMASGQAFERMTGSETVESAMSGRGSISIRTFCGTRRWLSPLSVTNILIIRSTKPCIYPKKKKQSSSALCKISKWNILPIQIISARILSYP